MRDRVTTAEPEPRCPDPKISETDQRRPDDQVALIPRKLGCAFPRDLNVIALLDNCQIDPFSPIEGEPEAIVDGRSRRDSASIGEPAGQRSEASRIASLHSQ